NRVTYEIMHECLLAEADFCLGWMHIRIDLGSWKLQEQENHRKNGWRKNVAIGFGQRVLHKTVANQPSVHEDEDGVAVQLLQLRFRDKAMKAHLTRSRRFIVWIPPPGRRLWQTNSLEI